MRLVDADGATRVVRGLAVLGALPILLAGCARDRGPEVSDQQKIEAAANHVATTTPPRIQVTEPYWEGRPSVPYANGKQLMAENPGCCRIGQHTFEVPAPRCPGEGYTLVTLRFGSRYIAPDGSLRRAHKERILAVNASGQVCAKDEY